MPLMPGEFKIASYFPTPNDAKRVKGRGPLFHR